MSGNRFDTIAWCPAQVHTTEFWVLASPCTHTFVLIHLLIHPFSYIFFLCACICAHMPVLIHHTYTSTLAYVPRRHAQLLMDISAVRLVMFELLFGGVAAHFYHCVCGHSILLSALRVRSFHTTVSIQLCPYFCGG